MTYRGTILVRRFTSDVSKLRAGEYIRRWNGVTVCCPCCALVFELDQVHEVDAGGTVTPIWICPSPACPAQSWLELEGWAATA